MMQHLLVTDLVECLVQKSCRFPQVLPGSIMQVEQRPCWRKGSPNA